jgi:hypothetical protein
MSYLKFKKFSYILNNHYFINNDFNLLLSDVKTNDYIVNNIYLRNFYNSDNFFIISNIVNFNKNFDNFFTNKLNFDISMNQVSFSSNNQFSLLLFKKNIQKEDLFNLFFNNNSFFNYNATINISNK